MAHVLAGLATLVGQPALSQPATADNDLEWISRQIAMKAVELNPFPLRWHPTRFPLRVAFAAGEALQQESRCPSEWQLQYEKYIAFLTAKKTLVKQTEMADTVDAYAFFGSKKEHDALSAFRLEKAWSSKPGISVLYDISDRFSHSYLGGYGSTEFLRFGADFQELDERTIACERFDPSEHLGSALLQSYAAFANAQVYRRFGDEGNFAVVWRVNRRLLSAMTQLPDGELGAERLKAALTEILSKE